MLLSQVTLFLILAREAAGPRPCSVENRDMMSSLENSGEASESSIWKVLCSYGGYYLMVFRLCLCLSSAVAVLGPRTCSVKMIMA